MIDNTSSTIDAGSLTPQSKASAANNVKVANISELTKTEVTTPEQVINHVSKAKENSESKHTTSEETTPKETTSEEIVQVVDKLNAFVQLTQRDISFGIDEQSGRDVISVFEAETQELIRQIPSEEALALLKRMDQAIGLLFSEKV
ncbi:MAG: flagellar protein FlaG [Colwellia sp.]|nr:flagellar protein FlaG [Colwellia sp.]